MPTHYPVIFQYPQTCVPCTEKVCLYSHHDATKVRSSGAYKGMCKLRELEIAKEIAGRHSLHFPKGGLRNFRGCPRAYADMLKTKVEGI